MSATSEPATVHASLNYFTPPANGERPYSYTYAPEPDSGLPRRNWEAITHPVEIENIRGHEGSVTLDTAGFQFGVAAPDHKSFANDAQIEKEYYPESIALIQKVTGASRVVLFDHTVRRNRPGEVDNSPDKRQPAQQVHVDQTAAAAAVRVHRHLPAEEVPELLRHRFQIINLWRPIHHAAFDFPLALCDYRTIDPKVDLVPADILFPGRKGENNLVKFSPAHRWKYLRGMRPEEYVLIKCYDSSEGVAVLTPHTAFKDPTTPDDAPLRESIELRALVFYD